MVRQAKVLSAFTHMQKAHSYICYLMYLTTRLKRTEESVGEIMEWMEKYVLTRK